jgi:hypothetical protein
MIRAIDLFLYRNSAALGTGWATPTWNVVDGIKDFDATDVYDMFENTVRRGRGLKTYFPTTDDVEINFMMTIPDNVLFGTTTATSAGNPDFDDYRAFQTAKRTRRVMDIMSLTGASTTNGAEGFRMFVTVADFSLVSGDQDGAMMKVKLKPAMPDETTLATSPTALPSLEVRVAAAAPTFSLWGADTFTYTPS